MNVGGDRFKSPPAKRLKKNTFVVKDTWTQKFCLLDSTDAQTTPSAGEQIQLTQAGLGLEKIVIPSRSGGHELIVKHLEENFSKLISQNGAFELLRAEGGGSSRPLILIPIPANGYQVTYLKKIMGTNSTIYIRPMQSNLSLEPDDSAPNVVGVNCTTCGNNFPLQEMREHQQCCLPQVLFPSKDVNESTGNLATSSKTGCSSQEDVFGKEEKEIINNMFPNISDDDINMVMAMSSSLDEAANVLTDKSTQNKPQKKSLGILPMGELMHCNFSSLKDFLFHISSLQEFELSNGIEIKIERDNFWMDSLRFYKKNMGNTDWMKKQLSVIFTGEEGLDGGAVKHEFFSLLLREVKKRLFEGCEFNLIPIKDITKGVLFRVAGMIIAHALIHEHPGGFPVLANCFYLHLLKAEENVVMAALSKSVIPKHSGTESLITLIEKLECCKLKGDVDTLLYSDSSEADIYWTIINSSHWPKQNQISIANISILIQHLMYNEIILSRRNETEELIAGLMSLGFYQKLVLNVDIVKPLLCFDEKVHILTKESIYDCFTFQETHNFVENQAKSWLIDYIGKTRKLSEFLCFVTGYRFMPYYGLKGLISVKYLPDDDTNSLPKSSACLKILYIPTVYSNKEKFFKAIDNALDCECEGFSNP